DVSSAPHWFFSAALCSTLSLLRFGNGTAPSSSHPVGARDCRARLLAHRRQQTSARHIRPPKQSLPSLSSTSPKKPASLRPTFGVASITNAISSKPKVLAWPS